MKHQIKITIDTDDDGDVNMGSVISRTADACSAVLGDGGAVLRVDVLSDEEADEDSDMELVVGIHKYACLEGVQGVFATMASYAHHTADGCRHNEYLDAGIEEVWRRIAAVCSVASADVLGLWGSHREHLGLDDEDPAADVCCMKGCFGETDPSEMLCDECSANAVNMLHARDVAVVQNDKAHPPCGGHAPSGEGLGLGKGCGECRDCNPPCGGPSPFSNYKGCGKCRDCYREEVSDGEEEAAAEDDDDQAS